MNPAKTETLIIGGGLSGLALADGLERAGRDWMLLEARDRFGGRIAGLDHGGTSFDLGPAWFWPGQPRLAALAERLGIEVFGQYASGATCYENADGTVQRVESFSAMAGSLRLAGGMRGLIDGLVAGLAPANLRLQSPVTAIMREGDHIAVTLQDGETLHALRVVIAIPPRVAAGITFDPPLSGQALRILTTIPTWMGSMAKFVAVYERPFWRDAGLSGDAMSRHGPMVEIHDASAMGGTPGALFGFLGLPAAQRATVSDQLPDACIAQFGRLFGEAALAPVASHLADWASDPFTATEADHQPLAAHPAYCPSPVLSGLWDGTLDFAVTETAPEHGGYAEGALSAAAAYVRSAEI